MHYFRHLLFNNILRKHLLSITNYRGILFLKGLLCRFRMQMAEEHQYEMPQWSGTRNGTNMTSTSVQKHSNKCLIIAVVVSAVLIALFIIGATIAIILTSGKQQAAGGVSTDGKLRRCE